VGRVHDALALDGSHERYKRIVVLRPILFLAKQWLHQGPFLRVDGAKRID
jgi:hypothetical protein